MQSKRVQIQKLVRLTREEFDLVYGPILACELDFSLAIAALRLRQAYLLPVGSDAETCYRQQEIWSYALFAYSLALRLKDLPEVGQAWLARYPDVLGVFQVRHQAAHSLQQIVAQAKKNLAECSVECAPEPEKNLFDYVVEMVLAKPKEGLAYRVEAGVLLVLPHCFQSFVQAYPQVAEQLLGGVLTQAAFIESLAQNVSLQNNEQGQRLHCYIQGDWAARQKVKGLLLARADAGSLANLAFSPEIRPDLNL